MDLIQYLVETAGADDAAKSDAESLRYLSRNQTATWLGPTQGVNYVSINGKKTPVNQVHATTAVPKNSKVYVRYANGKVVAYW
jgi:hypothetical protein